MLDYFCIFTKGGALLFAMSFATLKGDPVNALILNCLVEERTGERSYTYTAPSGGAYSLKWSLNNKLGLVFVAVYQKTLKLTYVDELLEKVNKAFTPIYKVDCHEYPEFTASFQRLLKDCETKADLAKRPTANAENTRTNTSQQYTATTQQLQETSDDDDGKKPDKYLHLPAAASAQSLASTEGTAGEGDSDGDEGSDGAGDASGAFNASLIKNKLAKRGPGSKVARGKVAEAAKAGSKKSAKPSGKQARVWDDLGGAGQAETGPLDFTDGAPPAQAVQETANFNEKSLVDVEEDVQYNFDVEQEEVGTKATSAGGGGLLSSFVRSIGVNVVGTQALTREDIAPALDELKKKLMERNVAEEIASKVTESVATSLEGQKLSSFTRVSSAVHTAVEAAITRILTPKRSIDILREVKACKDKGKVYTVVFVGVNGVGKSTNLAKICYWLLQNNLKVMIAACDTFRSGAVEQLKTHCARLNVPLYERGYEKDPAKVAFEAAKAAQRSGIDVLLVDTAGRMQDNEPLMRALANLINLNQPELTLFVGEALVGNDAVDQLTKFNRRLSELSTDRSDGVIDGIVLTKFDTIDDKVGAALSMVYTSGAPIMFVGCGQTYVDLKRLNVKSVVHSLLK